MPTSPKDLHPGQRLIDEEMDRVFGASDDGDGNAAAFSAEFGAPILPDRFSKPPYHGLMKPPSHRDHKPPLGDSMVVLPKHYSRFEIEPVHFTVTNKLDFLESNTVKYTMRAPYKHNDKGKQDYLKAIRSIVMKAKQMAGDPDWWKPYRDLTLARALEVEISYNGTA